MQRFKILIAFGVVLAGAGALAAQEPTATNEESWSSKLTLHGFGGWAYGKTSTNHFLFGNEQGEYDHSSFALNLAAEPRANFRILAQIEEIVDDGELEPELDYAFAEWRVSDALHVRVGQVQQPFGLYTEIFDVGVLRPFLTLPQSIYGPVELAAESYQGLGLTGSLAGTGSWSFDYDVYAGGLDFQISEPFGFLEPEVEHDEQLRDVLGGRFSITGPVSGLSYGASAFTGKREDTASRHNVGAVHLQYLSASLWLRAEAARLSDDEETARSGYLEAAYFLTPKWQVAGRYERLKSEAEDEHPRSFEPLERHREAALGLNYWFNHNLVVKASFHDVDGNRFSRPEEDLLQALESGNLRHQTRLWMFGAQFSF